MWSTWRSSVISTCRMSLNVFNLHFAKWCMCFHCVFATGKKKKANGGQEWIFELFLVPQRNKFVFQLVPTGTPMKVPMFTRSQKQSRHIQEETWSPPGSQTRRSGLTNTKTSGTRCSSLLRLSVRLPVCLSPPSAHSQLSPLHGQNLNLAANQNNVFMRILFTLWPCQRSTVHF